MDMIMAIGVTTSAVFKPLNGHFVNYGTPDTIPGAPCCIAMTTLSTVASSTGIQTRQSVCRCMMDLITTCNPNATAIATLPGFCGVSLGFTIDPNTDCE
ncbi:putative non-specific lipid-transfer protein 14 [Solanum tuberosum]|uniref:putative non-specific lipid-transfer protein 14 n=1 Tax=Solanum tuberosum TaxID=4113 RepID=UPI00073A52F1|nr:PREDICTED: putative non-specific lipid-transfer protein 14 [Solanum tuberosum]